MSDAGPGKQCTECDETHWRNSATCSERCKKRAQRSRAAAPPAAATRRAKPTPAKASTKSRRVAAPVVQIGKRSSEKKCTVCTGVHRRRSDFCSERCKKRAQRNPAPVPSQPDEPTGPRLGRLQTAVLAELSKHDRHNSPQGVTALLLAARLDAAADTGAAMAALSRELRAVLDEATLGAAAPDSALDMLKDEVAAARARRGA